MKKHILVWDMPLRLFHWLLVATICLCWLTAELGVDYRQQHFYLGYFALGLMIFRIVWGFVGPRHARFLSFIATPERLKHYLQNPKPTTGHNPLGSLMVVAMILLVSAQAISGLFINDDILYDAPYYGVLEEASQEVMFFIHEWAFNLLLASIALHVAAIIFYQRIKKHQLVLPMITGNKLMTDENKEHGIKSSRLVLAIALAICVGVLVYWLVVVNPPPVEEFYY